MLTDLYPPIIGGIELHVQNLGRALAERGHQVSVATLWHEGLPREEVVSGVRVHRLTGSIQRIDRVFNDSARRYAPPIPDPEVTLALRRLVRRERPQVVHAHNWIVHSFLPLKRPGGPRLVMTLHDYGLVCAKRSLMYREELCSGPAFAKCLRCAGAHYGPAKGIPITLSNFALAFPERAAVDLFLPVSSAVAEGSRLEQSGSAYEIVPNFVPDDVAEVPAGQPDPLPEGLPSGPFLLYVGALTRHKGVDVLLAAYERLASPPPLILIGTVWPDTPSTFPPGVTVLRSVPHAGVMAAFRRSLVALVPSRFPDPCPTVAMEAMAAGRPLIASRIGGLPDIVADGETGLLVRPGDPVALAAALERLLVDPGLAQRMGTAGRERVRAFSAGTVVTRIESIYGRVSAGRLP